MSVQLPPTGKYTADPQRSSITFTTRHMFGLGKVKGTFGLESASVVVAEPVNESTVRASIDAAGVDTGTARRDKDIRSAKFLDTERHPTIVFESTGVARGEGGTWLIQGLLTVRGHQEPIELTVDALTVTGGSLRISASTTIDRYAHRVTAAKGMAARRLQLSLNVTADPE